MFHYISPQTKRTTADSSKGRGLQGKELLIDKTMHIQSKFAQHQNTIAIKKWLRIGYQVECIRKILAKYKSSAIFEN